MKYIPPLGIADPDASWIDGNPATGVQGSIPPAKSWEHPLRELANLIKAANFVPTDADLQQVARSVRQGVNYLVATQIGGNPNTLTCANTGDIPTLTSLPAGLRLFVHIPANNTGPTTLVVDGMAAVSVIRANGAAAAADDLIGGMIAALVSDGTNLQIENFQGFTSSTTNNNTFNVGIPYIADTSVVTNAITAVFSPAITDRVGNRHVAVKLAHTLTGPSTITVNALASAPVVRPDGTPTKLNDAFVGEMLLLAWDGTNYQIINQIGLPPPPVLLANADWYVNTGTGHDTNFDGTSATVSGAHGPFKTIQRAATEVRRYNMNGFSQNIHIADGTYTEQIIFDSLNGSGTCNVIGNVASQDNVFIIGTTGRSAVFVRGAGSVYTFNGVKINSGSAPAVLGDPGDCMVVNNGCAVTLANITFAGALRAHLSAGFGASVTLAVGSIKIVGNAQWHILCELNSNISVQLPLGSAGWPALNIPSPVSFSISFVQADVAGTLILQYQSISGFGNVSGTKFRALSNGVISVNGTGVDYLPGTAAGTTDSGGQYV